MPSAMMQRPSRVNELRIDVPRHEVWLDGVELNLTRREWQLLLLLAEKPGHLVTPEQIFKLFFGDDWPEFDQCGISQHLTRLRRKIGFERIETVLKFGYKLRGKVRVS